MSSKRETPEVLLARARKTTDDLEARLLLAAAITEAGREVGVRVVVTGGTAVDFYASGALGTSAGYPVAWKPSGDLDVVVLSIGAWKPARKAILGRLETMGLQPHYFQDTARQVDVPDFPFYVELVSEELGSRDRDERTMTVLLDGTAPLEMRSPENVILAYAESGLHMRHTGDWTRALAVHAAMHDRLDLAWLRSEAERRGQTEALEAILQGKPAPWQPLGPAEEP